MYVKLENFHNFRDKYKKSLKPPPSFSLMTQLLVEMAYSGWPVAGSALGNPLLRGKTNLQIRHFSPLTPPEI